MKKFNITVNGTAYEVEVEEVKDKVAAAPKAAAPAPKAAPAPAAPAAPAKAAVAAGAGEHSIDAPMPGKILSVKVSEGQTINKGDVVVVLEAMKMENEIYASEGGVVASVNVSAGDMVEGGDVLATIN